MYKTFATLILSSVLSMCFLFSYAQDNKSNFNTEFEKTAQSIVMVKADYGETEEFGAGIVFGREKDRLLIATAHHIFSGSSKPVNIQVQFRSMPQNKYVTAKLLRFDDEEGLDVAVLSAENLKEQGVDACSIPFDRLGKTYKIERGDMVYAVGNPNGVSWATPVVADRISGVNNNLIDFQSNFISKGHSGGGLLDERGFLIGMTTLDAQPFGRAINLDAVLNLMKKWKYTVQLDTLLPGKWTPLHMAAYNGDIAAIKFHLSDCGDPNTVNAHNVTPLHCAAASGSVEALSILLKAGANPNILDNDGDLPLEWAIEKECFECVKLLVNAGTKLNTQNKKGETVLHIAIDSSQQKTALFLIQAGADVNLKDKRDYTPLYQSVRTDQMEIVKALLRARANVNSSNNGFTTIWSTVYDNNIEMAKALLKADAKPDLGSPIPLHEAVSLGRIEFIKLLSAYGANMDIADGSGNSPLAYAINWFSKEFGVGYIQKSPSIKIVRALIESGAHVDAAIEDKSSYLILATRRLQRELFNNYDGEELLNILIKSGAKVNVQDDDGNTPLHYILNDVDNKTPEYVKILVDAGADPNIKNKEGKLPLDRIEMMMMKISYIILNYYDYLLRPVPN